MKQVKGNEELAHLSVLTNPGVETLIDKPIRQ